MATSGLYYYDLFDTFFAYRVEIMSHFELIDNQTVTEYRYEEWVESLVESAQQKSPKTWYLEDECLRIRCKDRYHTSLTYGIKDFRTTVEINCPIKSGNANYVTGVAKDDKGRIYLLRQGRLKAQGNNSKSLGNPSVDISGNEFRIRTGLVPLELVKVESGPRNREWYIVAVLDKCSYETEEGQNTRIMQETAEFVRCCENARRWSGSNAGEEEDRRVTHELRVSGESAAPYVRGERPATSPKMIRQLQGEVWEALNRELRQNNKDLEKLKSDLGYEVDGIIRTRDQSLLLEIKSHSSAADVYEGVGQLMLYRKLFPSLKEHHPVLLLPQRPQLPLAEAVERLGIQIETYEWCGPSESQVTFSSSFLELCELRFSL